MASITTEAEAPRRRKAPRVIRRRQILEATIESISKHGFAETTLARVAKLAGISQASLIFHFKTKDALLVETLRHLSDEYRETWQGALAAAPDEPVARICALVAADFAPHLCSRKKVAVWLAFWAEAKSRPTYMQICGERDDERAEIMRRECARALAAFGQPTDTAADRAAVIDGLSDGFWQRLLMDHDGITRRDSLRLMFLQVASQFPQAAEAIEDWADRLWRKSARRRSPGPETPGRHG